MLTRPIFKNAPVRNYYSFLPKPLPIEVAYEAERWLRHIIEPSKPVYEFFTPIGVIHHFNLTEEKLSEFNPKNPEDDSAVLQALLMNNYITGLFYDDNERPYFLIITEEK